MVPTPRLVLGKNRLPWNGWICSGLNLASKVCVYVCVCVCVSMCECSGTGFYVFCKEAKVMPFSACHQPGTQQFSTQSPLSAPLNFVIKSLLSGEGDEKALSSKIRFTFRQFASFCVIVLLELLLFLPNSSASHLLIVSLFGLGNEPKIGLLFCWTCGGAGGVV